MYCWICNDIIFNKYYLLPNDDNIKPETYHIVKKIDCFTFIYNTLCENCLDIYLKNYPVNFKKLCDREYGIKKN